MQVQQRFSRRQAAPIPSSMSKQQLTLSQRRLLELMQEISFGSIEGLVVRGGQPVMDPAPRRRREVRLGGENGPRPERELHDFVLKVQFVELFAQLQQIGDGEVDLIEVRHGLPQRLILAEGPR